MSDSIRHPSYGMVSISHTNSTGTYLAGSEFKHQHFVALKICRGSVERSLSREWWFGREEIIEVWLSEAQFVEFMARPNISSGVPCTIKHIEGRQMPEPPPPESEAEKFRQDFKVDCQRVAQRLDDALDALMSMLNGVTSINKTGLKEVLSKVEMARQDIASNLPFVAKSFDEQIEQTIHHAAAEIEATVANIAVKLGMEQMRSGVLSAPEMVDLPALPAPEAEQAKEDAK